MDYNLNFVDIYTTQKNIEKFNINNYNKINLKYKIGDNFYYYDGEYTPTPIWLKKTSFFYTELIQDKFYSYKFDEILNIIIKNNNKMNKIYFDFTGSKHASHISQLYSKNNIYTFNIKSQHLYKYVLCFDLDENDIDIDISFSSKSKYNILFDTIAFSAGRFYNTNIYSINSGGTVNSLYDMLNDTYIYIDIQTLQISFFEDEIKINTEILIEYNEYEIKLKPCEKNNKKSHKLYDFFVIINKIFIKSNALYNIIIYLDKYLTKKYNINNKSIMFNLLYNKIEQDNLIDYINYKKNINDYFIN